jgi:alkyldihydroxyacetonephosphate synthase
LSEKRTILSLDLTQMNRMLWLNEKSMLACFESGVCGQDLEKFLNQRGFTMGHIPDSIEFSTLGGWIATKSSGMKQHIYGNIENLVVRMKFVTSVGVFDQNMMVTPRSSCGPDFERLFIGSEGTLGVITEAVVKIHKMPKCTTFGLILFPTFNHGVEYMRECSKNEWLPANMRLFCNTNIKVGIAFEQTDIIDRFLHPFKMLFRHYILRYHDDTFAVAAYMLEGTKKDINEKDKVLRKISKKFQGFYAGEKYAKLGYVSSSTYIAYIRVRNLIF